MTADADALVAKIRKLEKKLAKKADTSDAEPLKAKLEK